MFLRLKNLVDYEIIKDDMDAMVCDSCVGERVKEVLTILDDSYGKARTSRDMGGYVFLFSNETTYNASIDKILINSNIQTSMCEYSDIISSSQDITWKEELYLVSSDDSITVIHPVVGGGKSE